MAETAFTLHYATHRNVDDYSGAYENANYTTEQAAEILAEGDFEHADTRRAVYEQAYAISPDDFAQTYSIIERMENDAQVQPAIRQDARGNDHFVALFRNVYGGSLNIAISEGHLILNSLEGLSAEEYRNLARFCWMNSMNIEFPDNVDEHFRRNYEQAYAAYEQEVRLGGHNSNDATAQEVNEALNQEHLSDDEIEAAASHLPENERADFILSERNRRAAERAAEESKSNLNPNQDKIDNSMQTFMKRLGKVSGETFFRSNSILSGETVYRLYKDPNAYKKDGRPQKDGSYANTYEIEMRFKVDKDGNLAFTFGTPNNATIDQAYADEMVGMMKSQGYTHINFDLGDTIQDGDKGKFRESCARNGVIPEGFNLNEHHVKKMIDIASGSLSSKDLLVYKERMVERLRRQLKQQNIEFDSEDNRLYDIINSLEGEVRYAKLHKAYDGMRGGESISDVLHKVVREVDPNTGRADAVKVIGAANAFSEFIEAYDKYCTGTVQEFLAANVLNLPEERREFLEQTGLSPNDQTKLKDLDPKHLVTIYKCMIKEQEDKAEQVFRAQFSNPNREEVDADFVKDQVRMAYEGMLDKSNIIKEKGGGSLYVERLGNPKYSGPVTPVNYHNNYQMMRRRGNGRR